MGEPVIVRVDHREVGSGVPEALREIPGVQVCLEHLALADYLLSPSVAVERKSAADLAASIVDRRLFTQVRELAEAYPRVIHLIEGESLYAASNLHPNALRGALSYLAVLAGSVVLRSEDAEDSAWLLATMARHAQQGLGYDVSYHAARRAADPDAQARYVVEELPGIGPKTAHALLERFGSLRALFAADAEALREVPGVGRKRAERIDELLTRRYAPSEGGEAPAT